MIRKLSHSEASSAFTCQAQHDFRYVGQLAGDALKPRTTAPILRDGRAWGAGVATLHANALRTDADAMARQAIKESLDEDYQAQQDQGLADPLAYENAQERLFALLDHYSATSEPLPIDRVEHELEVPIPSRSGRRRSNRYRLVAFIDGIHVDDDGREWLVEYKLRGQLTPLEQIVLSRQIRWYAWAAREDLGINPVGVIVDERWNEIPKPARLVQGRKKGAGMVASHAKDQLTTPELYIRACRETGEVVNEDTLAALGSRRWQQRHPIIFRPGELDEAGVQLISAARLIHGLDSGELFPVRNPSRAHCGGCAFREICPNPDDVDLVDALFERQPAKKDRDLEEAIAA